KSRTAATSLCDAAVTLFGERLSSADSLIKGAREAQRLPELRVGLVLTAALVNALATPRQTIISLTAMLCSTNCAGWPAVIPMTQHVLRREGEPDDEDGNAAVYPAHKCIFEEARKSRSYGRALCALVQLRPRSQELAHFASNGGGDRNAALV